MSCDCPYAKGNGKCKHMAAVLFKIEEKQKEAETKEAKEKLDKILSVDKAREKQLEYQYFNRKKIHNSIVFSPSIIKIALLGSNAFTKISKADF